jgi:flagellar biosynthetic protein FlhB
MSDVGERTEQATPKRLKEAHDKGRISTSRDLSAWLSVGAAAATIPAVVSAATDLTGGLLVRVGSVVSDPEPQIALSLLGESLDGIMPALGPLLAAVMIAGVAGTALQGGIHVKSLAPNVEHLNPAGAIKRMFGPAGLWEGAKALLKTAVVAAVLVVTVQGLMPVLMSAGALPVANLIDTAIGGITALIQSAVVAGIGLALIDLLVVQRRNRQHTRMTKKEVKDESKNSEGDPLVRSQRRSRQLAMSRNRMIAAVSSADVVLLNPTHLAVALSYEAGKSAPRVVAKGADEIALRIREKADEHRVPMVRDVPLARALYASCEVGHEIPLELYAGVAAVLAFVFSLNARGARGGIHQLTRSPL